MNRKLIYTSIFELNYWRSKESVSGEGSELKYTKVLIEGLPDFLKKYNIKTILDIPCGDFNFMKEVEWPCDIQYIGADIVDKMVLNNMDKYSKWDIDNLRWKFKFEILDIIDNKLPKVDLVIVKDLFIHFSYVDIFAALENIKKSGSKYLLTSHGEGFVNEDIPTGGGWRGVNLIAAPYNLPKPIDNIMNLYLWEIVNI